MTNAELWKDEVSKNKKNGREREEIVGGILTSAAKRNTGVPWKGVRWEAQGFRGLQLGKKGDGSLASSAENS